MKQLKTSYMNKKQKDHQSIIPGHSIAARVVNYDLGFAIRIWKKKLKDSDILLKLRENKEFIKPSVIKRAANSKARYIQQIRSKQDI